MQVTLIFNELYVVKNFINKNFLLYYYTYLSQIHMLAAFHKLINFFFY